MKCDNCRCIIPESSDYCVYCGHAVYKGDKRTFPVPYGGVKPYHRSMRAEWYGDTYSAPACDTAYNAALINPTYHESPDNVQMGDFENVSQTENMRYSGISNWDFSVINGDGTLNVIKLMLYFAGLDMVLILILLLLILAFML